MNGLTIEKSYLPANMIDNRNIFVALVFLFAMASCTSTATVETKPEHTLTTEILNSRIAQSENSIYYQCQDHLLAVYDGNLYRKQGARFFELLSTGIEYGTYRWDSDGVSNEFNPFTKIEIVRDNALVERFECRALSFYDKRERFSIATDRYSRPEFESSATEGIRAEESNRRSLETLQAKQNVLAKNRARLAKPAAAKVNLTANTKKSVQATQETNAAIEQDTAPRPGISNNSNASPKQSTPPLASPEPKAEAQGMNNPPTKKESDGEKKTEASNSTEQHVPKEKQSDEKPGWLAWLRKKLGLK